MANKRGRPINPNSDYKIIVHRNNGTTYVMTQPRDKDGKRKYKCWGILEEGTKRFIPGKNFLSATKKERDKLIFPEGWDLSAIGELEARLSDGIHLSREPHTSRFWGGTWFMKEVAKKTGVWQDLLDIFDSETRADMALTLAVYPEMSQKTCNQLECWQRKNKGYTEAKLDPPTIHAFCSSITDAEREEFLKKRIEWDRVRSDEIIAERKKELENPNHLGASNIPDWKHRNPGTLLDKYAAVDSTTMTSYSETLVQVRNGHNKEKGQAKQTVEVIVYSLITHLPIYYIELQGNVNDSKTMHLILKKLRKAGFKDVIIVTDRGYDTMEDIELAIAADQPVVTCASVERKDVKQKIRSLGAPDTYVSQMDVMEEEKGFFCKQWKETYEIVTKKGEKKTVDNYYTNLYFSPSQRGDALYDLELQVRSQAKEAEEIKAKGKKLGKKARSDKEKSWPLLKITWDDKGKMAEIERNKEVLDERTLTAGFHAIKSIYVELDAKEAHRVYGYRDEQEKAFKTRKSDNASYRHRAWNELARKGRNFLWYVGLILNSYIIQKQLESKVLKDNFDSAHAIIDEMECIKIDEYSGNDYVISPFVGKQILVTEEFGFTIPEEAGADYHSLKVVEKKKRGRPRKDQSNNLQ